MQCPTDFGLDKIEWNYIIKQRGNIVLKRLVAARNADEKETTIGGRYTVIYDHGYAAGRGKLI